MGILCCFWIVLLLSGRIWSIEVSGESYHTKESILKYLDSIGIYGGMAKKELHPVKVREILRKKYQDIGWISVEETGSQIHIRIKEVQMVKKEKKKKRANLVADADGTVVSIVTRTGTAQVRAGEKVKKGSVLISGEVQITGDGEEVVETDYVHADGDVVLQEKKTYRDILKKKYQKKEYTGRERSIYEWKLFGKYFFLYNPLNNLESYKKYDIIREGGVLYQDISLRSPVEYHVKRFREIRYVPAVYQKAEAEQILKERYLDFVKKKKDKGYALQNSLVGLRDMGEAFQYEGTMTFYKKQETYRVISNHS